MDRPVDDINSNAAADGVPSAATERVLLPPTKTPMYQAINAARYQRQALIRNMQEKTGRRLICYVTGIGAMIDRDDPIPFVDLLHNLADGEDLDLLLQTPGGDIDAAEKIISMVHRSVGEASLRVIVPDYAKSAGTLMALGANKIVMSDTSELGPIDPQIALSDGRGNRIQHSVLSYLDAYETHSTVLEKNPANVTAQIMLNKLDPATVKLFESLRMRARKFAEAQLSNWMLKGKGENITKIAGDLMDLNLWQTHGQMIGWRAALSLHLQVEYVAPRTDEWQRIWQLYCLQRLAIKDHEKIFESDYASMIFDGSRG